MAPDPLAVIKIATSAIEGLRHIRPKEKSRDTRVQNAVSLILRELYFAPDGILSLLREIADGEHPTETRLKQALVDFNDRQWKIEEALESLEFDVLKKELGLSLNSLRALLMLREGKSELRWTVQQEVNFYGQEGVWPRTTRVRKLIKAIEDLNTAIEQVEETINQRASVGPLLRAPLPKLKSPLKKGTSRKKAVVSRARKTKGKA
jgi:hypothetical protein